MYAFQMKYGILIYTMHSLSCGHMHREAYGQRILVMLLQEGISRQRLLVMIFNWGTGFSRVEVRLTMLYGDKSVC